MDREAWRAVIHGVAKSQTWLNWTELKLQLVKNPSGSAGDARDVGSIPGSGRSPVEGNGNPLQYSCLEKPMDREAWWAMAHGVAESQTRLSVRTHTHPHKLQKESGLDMLAAVWWVTLLEGFYNQFSMCWFTVYQRLYWTITTLFYWAPNQPLYSQGIYHSSSHKKKNSWYSA